MRFLLLAAATVAAWLVWRRRGRAGRPVVVVGWQDGAEVELRPGTPQHERLVSLAARSVG